MEVRQGGELSFSSHGRRYKKKCSSTVPSDFCVDPQRIIFSVDLVNSYFCSPPIPALSFCSSSEVKQNVMYCILYDFFRRVIMSWSRCWEGNRSQLYYIFKKIYIYREERGQVQLLFFVLIPCEFFFSFHVSTVFQVTWKLVSSAGGNWKELEPQWRLKKRGDDEMDDPAGHYPQDNDYYPQF